MSAKSRIPYSERMKQELEELLIRGGAETVVHPLDAFVRQGARYLIQKALEMELDEFLGRAHYQRGARRQAGFRNGYEPHRFKTPSGILTVGAPQARQTRKTYRSKILKRLDGDPNAAISRLALGMYVRGLSQRDVEDLWVEVFGRKILSKSGTSELSENLTTEFNQWRRRDLSGIKPLYLFLDGLFLALRQGTDEKEGVLAAYCITDEGRKILLHLALGWRESYADWLGFIQDMVSRGLPAPLLAIHDGRAGLIRAIKESWPHSYRQHCQVHKMRNILSKLPKKAIPQIKKMTQDVFRAPSYEQGLQRGQNLIANFRQLYPSAMECLQKDLQACLTYLKFPKEHAKVIRTTNLLERTFGEGRRRTKVIPRFPTETSALSLVFAVLTRASQKWKGVRITPKIRAELEALRAKIQIPGSPDMGRASKASCWASGSVEQMHSIRDSEITHSNAELVGLG